jgi:Spy/CpxP family protein refolding chaperone
MGMTRFNTGKSDNAISKRQRMTDMKFTSLSAAAALLAACIATTCATPAFALGESDAPPAAAHDGPDGGHGRGPGGPGPAWHGFGGHGPGAPGPDMPFGRMHGLKLSDAQQDKLFAIMHAQAPQRREHEKAIRKAHEGLRELAHADRFDDAKASALSRELGQAVAAEALLHARTAAQALAVLTPEQREQLRQHRQHGPSQRGRDGAERPQGPPDRR